MFAVTEVGAISAHYEEKLLRERVDLEHSKRAQERLQDEVVELRAQMETPDHEDCSTEEVMRDGALMTVVWRRRERWSAPEVVAVYHGAYCLYTSVPGRDGDLDEAPRWALRAVNRAVAVEEEMPPRFMDVGCSRCGARFGPGNAGYSHCDQHQHRAAKQ